MLGLQGPPAQRRRHGHTARALRHLPLGFHTQRPRLEEGKVNAPEYSETVAGVDEPTAADLEALGVPSDTDDRITVVRTRVHWKAKALATEREASELRTSLRGVRAVAGGVGRGGGEVIVLPEPPSSNRYWRNVAGKTLLSKEARVYREAVQTVCTAKRVRPVAGAVVLQLAWYRARRAGDLDNRIKQVLDALRGHAYADDAQVVELHAYRFEDAARPRVEITVRAA
ncbi:MAG: hypothetical protein C0499_05710 [Zymomonas sp.]|nr:hypothetical protein [Zymomonas sp.]